MAEQRRLPFAGKKNCVYETKGRTNQCVEAELVVGRARFEYQTMVPKECARHGRPELETNYFSRAFPHHVTSQLVHRFVDREIVGVAPMGLISILVKFDLKRRWSAAGPLDRPPTMAKV